LATHDFALIGALAAAIFSTVGALFAQKRIVETVKRSCTNETTMALRNIMFIGLGIIEIIPVLTWIAVLVLIFRH